MNSCKTCKHLDVPRDSLGRIVVRKGKVYECVVDVPEPILPDCITKAFGHSWPSLGYSWPPKRRYMGGDDGIDCPSWIMRSRQTNR